MQNSDTLVRDYLTQDFFSFVGLSELAESDKQAFLEQMNETVMLRVYQRIHEMLGSEIGEEMEHIAPDQIESWLAEHDISFRDMLSEEAASYRMQLAFAFHYSAQALSQPVAA